MGVDVLLRITVPVLTGHHVLELYARQWERQHLRLWLEDLIVRVLDLDSLLLDSRLHPLVVLKVESFLCEGLQVLHELVPFLATAVVCVLDEGLSGEDYDRLVLHVVANLLS